MTPIVRYALLVSVSLCALSPASPVRAQQRIRDDRGHSALDAERMMEFFIESLVLEPGPG